MTDNKKLLYIGAGKDWLTLETEWAEQFETIICCDDSSQQNISDMDIELFTNCDRYELCDWKDVIDEERFTDILLRGYIPHEEMRILCEQYNVHIACDTYVDECYEALNFSIVHLRTEEDDKYCVCETYSDNDNGGTPSHSDSDNDKKLLYIGAGTDWQTLETEWAEQFETIICCDDSSQQNITDMDIELFANCDRYELCDWKDVIDEESFTDILLKGYIPHEDIMRILCEQYNVHIACDTYVDECYETLHFSIVHLPFEEEDELCACETISEFDNDNDNESDSDESDSDESDSDESDSDESDSNKSDSDESDSDESDNDV